MARPEIPEDAYLEVIKEFRPGEPNNDTSRGRLVVRSATYGKQLSMLDRLFAVMAADAAAFEPPYELGRDKVDVLHHGGDRYAGTYGLEVNIPPGYVISEEYVRIEQLESSR